ncbi:MAG TPA: molybdopterin-dependent oxidoreductase [Steroidobacteraceae bacterium]|jgi:sulfite dehydrogenase|nr:molybdopterin-dependent oxidoreductase [Steroidobacteraceae bacterium]
MTTRREWLLAAAGGWLAGLTGRGGLARAAASGTDVDPLATLPGKRPLIRHAFRPPNYETPLADLVPAFTRNDAFFVRYHLAVIPVVDPRTWRLQVGGPGARQPLVLSLPELKRGYPRVSLAAVNQCSGNRRGLFTPRVPGVQWGNGAMGNAEWRGVRLRDVLAKAGVGADAVEVAFNGADAPVLPATPDFLKSIPIERALDENTLIAFEMNGAPLPHWNGAPARLVVPGWTGTYWVKHLTEIRIETQPFQGFWMKSAYRIPTGVFPGARFLTQETPENTPITEMLVNSLITSHVPGARLARGAPAALAGKAWDGGSGIAAVEISTDGRRTWREATLGRDLGRFAWREFRLPVDTSSAGTREFAVRARGGNGAQQPDALIPNPGGYHDNIVQTLTLEVL